MAEENLGKPQLRDRLKVVRPGIATNEVGRERRKEINAKSSCFGKLFIFHNIFVRLTCIFSALLKIWSKNERKIHCIRKKQLFCPLRLKWKLLVV
jgi:hypothetical protein